MSELVIIAAGGLARETVASVRERGTDQVIGLLDDDAGLWGSSVAGLPVVGGIDRLSDRPDAWIVLCAGKGRARADLAARIGAPESRYATVLDSAAAVRSTCDIGPGSIVLSGAVLTESVRIGRHVVVMPNVTLTHDNVVEDYATLCAGVSLAGGVTVGVGAYVGMNVCVREGVVIGEGATVGMGSVVLRDIGPGETWVGAPARRRPRPKADGGRPVADWPPTLRVVPPSGQGPGRHNHPSESAE